MQSMQTWEQARFIKSHSKRCECDQCGKLVKYVARIKDKLVCKDCYNDWVEGQSKQQVTEQLGYQDDKIECRQTKSGYCEFPGQCKECDYGCRGHKHKDIKEGIYCDLSKSHKCEHKGIPCTKCVLVIGSEPEHLKHLFKADNYDIFVDRAVSLLDRWKRFRDAHPDRVADAISGFLNEVGDEYTQNLIFNAKNYK